MENLARCGKNVPNFARMDQKSHAGQINKPKLKLDFNRRIHPKVSFYWLIKKIEQKISKLTTKRIALDLELFC